MGFLSWLFKEEDPPEPLVFGALLQCPHGSKKSYLFVETDNLDINHLPQACVDDCKAYKNIEPFGECLSGSLCEYKIELEKQWENPEPQTMLVNGKEIITTKSVLLCKAEGVGIEAIKSGQDRVFAKQVLLYAEMDAKYPGLSKILDDPYGNLYLKEGMYEKAIQFMEDRLINGLETAGYQNGMDEDAGYDVHTLNAEMIEMLRRDCKKTAEKIETDENARWMEEHKKFMTIFADSVTEFAYGVAIYHSMTAKERSQGRDEIEERGEGGNGEAGEVEGEGNKEVARSESGNGAESDKIITDGSHLENGKLRSNVTYKTGEHDYIYKTNEDGLIVDASTDSLQLKTHEGRLNHNSNTYGKVTGDHAGHLFGDRFGGSPELDNLVSQAQKVNQSDFKIIENQWAKAIESGQNVTVDINTNYNAGDMRPISFDVFYTIDEVPFFQTIVN